MGFLLQVGGCGFAEFCGFVAGGGLPDRESLGVSSGVCRARARRSTHRVSLEVMSGVQASGQALQIQDRAVTQGVVGGAIF